MASGAVHLMGNLAPAEDTHTHTHTLSYTLTGFMSPLTQAQILIKEDVFNKVCK